MRECDNGQCDKIAPVSFLLSSDFLPVVANDLAPLGVIPSPRRGEAANHRALHQGEEHHHRCDRDDPPADNVPTAIGTANHQLQPDRPCASRCWS